MNKKSIITALLAIALTSCHQLSQKAEAEQSTDSTETVTGADTLRLVITDKHLSQTDSLIRRSSSRWDRYLGMTAVMTQVPLSPRLSFLIIHLEVSILLFTFAPVMLGQASAIKVRNQVSEYPPLSKLAGCFFVPRYGLQRYEIFLKYIMKRTLFC